MVVELIYRYAIKCLSLFKLKVHFLNMHAHAKVYSIEHFMIKICQKLVEVWWFCLGTSVSSNISDCHDITELL